MAAEHVLDDVAHGALLVHPAVPGMTQKPRPWHKMQSVPGQPAVAAKQAGLGNMPPAVMVLPVVEAGEQRPASAQPGVERQVGIRVQHIHPVIESAGQVFMAPPLFDEQRRQALGLQAVQLVIGLQPDQRSKRGMRK